MIEYFNNRNFEQINSLKQNTNKIYQLISEITDKIYEYELTTTIGEYLYLIRHTNV